MKDNRNFEGFLQKNLKGIEKKLNIPNFILQKSPSKLNMFFSVKKIAFLLVSFFIILFISLTPQGKAFYNSIFGSFFIDRGLQQAETQGKIQKPMVSVTDNGITLTLQAVSTDSTRTVLQVKLFEQGKEINVLSINSLELYDEKKNVYHLEKSNSYGVLQFKPFDNNVKNAILKVKSINGKKGDWSLEFPITMYKSRVVMPNLKQEMSNGNQLVINKINFGLTQTEIEIIFPTTYHAGHAKLLENGKQAFIKSIKRDLNNENIYHYSFEPITGNYPVTLILDFENQQDLTILIPNM